MSERTNTPSPPDGPASAPGRRRWPRRVALALFALVLLVAAAPYILAQAPFRNWLLGRALAELNGEVRAGGATFDWFQPIALYDLQVIPPDGPPVLVVPVVEGSIPLWKLLTDPKNLGVFRIDHPRVEIELREGGSSLRDLLAKIEKPPEQQDQPQANANQVAGGATVGIDLIAATLTVRRKGSQTGWDARNIQLSARIQKATEGEERELVVAPGRVLDHIAITPEVCDDFLKYLAPTLAKVTRAGGSFSLDLEHCRLPLEMPRQGDVLGHLTLHNVEAGPGPMIEQVAALFGAPNTSQLATEQVVEFQLKDERAYHRDMTFAVGTMAIGTEGSVGLADQSLDLTVNVRMPEFANETAPFRAALSGQTLNLPIGGTLNKPQLDRNVLRESGLGVLSGVLDSLMQGKPISADAIDDALRSGGLVGSGTTLPPAAAAENSPAAGANGAPAASAANVAAPAIQIVEDLLRQRAANLERRRTEAAANPDGTAPPATTEPPTGRPLRRRARQLFDTLTKPPPAETTPPPATPPDV